MNKGFLFLQKIQKEGRDSREQNRAQGEDKDRRPASREKAVPVCVCVFFKQKGKTEEVFRKAVKECVTRSGCSGGAAAAVRPAGRGQRRPEAPHQQRRRCTNTYCRYRLPTTKKHVVVLVRFVWEYKILLAVQLCCPPSQVFEAQRGEREYGCLGEEEKRREGMGSSWQESWATSARQCRLDDRVCARAFPDSSPPCAALARGHACPATAPSLPAPLSLSLSLSLSFCVCA
jgi:hypothetical protein